MARPLPQRRLHQHFPDHVALHIGQPALHAVVLKCKLLVVEAKEVQYGRV